MQLYLVQKSQKGLGFMGHSWGETSRFVQTLLLLQAAIIVGLLAWTYNEYINNSYLRTYLASLLQGTGKILAVMSVGGVVAIVLVGILLKASSVYGDIEHLSQRVVDQTDVSQARSEMSMTMPVLKVVEPEPVDEISRLHSSLRRWKERSK